eukprot:5634825-Prorocentrum_lima.AAC.1
MAIATLGHPRVPETKNITLLKAGHKDSERTAAPAWHECYDTVPQVAQTSKRQTQAKMMVKDSCVRARTRVRACVCVHTR